MGFEAISTIVELSEFVTTQWDVKFPEALDAASKQFENFTMNIVTKQLGVEIPFINTWEDLENIELYGDPTYTTVRAQKINRTIERYAKGITIGKPNFADPVAQSLLLNQLGSLVSAAARRRSKAIMDALKNGDSSAVPVYDEVTTTQNLFSNTHTLNGITFDNLLTGGLNITNLQLGLDKLNAIPLGPDGEYLPMTDAKIFCVIPTQLTATLDLINNSTTIYEQNIVATNPYKGIVEKISDNYFNADANDWYMIAVFQGLSPFVTVEHVDSDPGLKEFISEDDPQVAEKLRYRWLISLLEETYPVHYYQMIKFVNSN